MRDDRDIAVQDVPEELRGGTPAQERKLRAQGRKTMGKLLDAGSEVFAKRGYSATRVDDIVKLAKTSHGTFYLYFSNKEDLLKALLHDCVEDMSELAFTLDDIGPGPEGEAALREWLGRYQSMYEDYWPVIHAWSEAEQAGVEFGALGREALGQFAALFADRIRQTNKDERINPDVAGLVFVAMIERFHFFLETRQMGFDAEDVLDTLARIAHRGIFHVHD